MSKLKLVLYTEVVETKLVRGEYVIVGEETDDFGRTKPKYDYAPSVEKEVKEEIKLIEQTVWTDASTNLVAAVIKAFNGF